MSGVQSVFDLMADRYDGWFDSPDGSILFQNELEAVRLLWSDGFRPALEVGVGTGRFAQALGVEFGVDPAAAALRVAEARGVKVVQVRGEALPFEDGRFRGVLMIATLCFAEGVPALFREAARVLEPGGRLLVGDIPAGSAWGRHYLRKKAEGHPFYSGAHLFTVGELERMCRESGFAIERAVSTLRQPPEAPAQREPPVSGASESAGFVCLLARKSTTPPERRTDRDEGLQDRARRNTKGAMHGERKSEADDRGRFNTAEGR